MRVLGVVGALLRDLRAGRSRGVFTQDPRGRAVRGRARCASIALGFLFYAYGMVLVAVVQRRRRHATPTLLNLFVFWLFGDPARVGAGEDAGLRAERACSSRSRIAFSTYAVAGSALFRRGTWKTRRVSLVREDVSSASAAAIFRCGPAVSDAPALDRADRQLGGVRRDRPADFAALVLAHLAQPPLHLARAGRVASFVIVSGSSLDLDHPPDMVLCRAYSSGRPQR